MACHQAFPGSAIKLMVNARSQFEDVLFDVKARFVALQRVRRTCPSVAVSGRMDSIDMGINFSWLPAFGQIIERPRSSRLNGSCAKT